MPEKNQKVWHEKFTPYEDLTKNLKSNRSCSESLHFKKQGIEKCSLFFKMKIGLKRL